MVPAEVPPILSLEFTSGAMLRDQVHTVLVEVGIEAIAVIRPIPDEMLGRGLEQVAVETECTRVTS